MAIPLTGTAGFFTRIGLKIGGLNENNLFFGTTAGTTRPNNISAQYNTTDQNLRDGLYSTFNQFKLQGASLNSYYSQFSQNDLVQMAQDSAPLNTGQSAEALNVLIAQMIGSADSIKNNTVSVATSVGSNTGDGVVAASSMAADGKDLENIIAEDVAVKVTADSYTGGATAGQESLSVVGVQGPTDKLSATFATSGYGSNVNQSIRAIDSASGPSQAGNLLNNSDYESWGAVSANLPNQWATVVGVPGTDILKTTTSYSGTYALEFLGDGTTLSGIQQQFNNSSGTLMTLSPRQVLAMCVRTRIGSSAPGAGALRISLVDGSGTVITNDAGANNEVTIDLTAETTSFAAHTAFFQLPTILPAAVYFRVQLSTALSSGKFVIIDHLACTVATQLNTGVYPSLANNIAGGPYVAAFSGVTPFVLNDSFTVTVANDYGGKFQMGIWKFFNTPALGVRVPSSGSNTINENLVV